MAQIADAADVSVRTVQRHYASKDELLLDACLIEPSETIPDVAEEASECACDEVMGTLLRRQFAFYVRHGIECGALYARAIDAPSVQQALREADDRRQARIAGLVARWPDVWATDTGKATRVLAAMTSYRSWQAFNEIAGLSYEETVTVAGDMLRTYLLK